MWYLTIPNIVALCGNERERKSAAHFVCVTSGSFGRQRDQTFSMCCCRNTKTKNPQIKYSALRSKFGHVKTNQNPMLNGRGKIGKISTLQNERVKCLPQKFHHEWIDLNINLFSRVLQMQVISRLLLRNVQINFQMCESMRTIFDSHSFERYCINFSLS